VGVSSFFDYPGEETTGGQELVFLPGRADVDWTRLLHHMETIRFRAGEVVIAAGEADRALYLISEGTVEVLVPARRGLRRVRTQSKGTILGEVAFLDGRPRSATVQGVTDGEILRLSLEGFEALSARHPDLGRAILFDLGRILAARLRQAEALLAT